MVGKEQCTGCSACAMSCGMGAIQMVADREGFLYPRIDAESCVDCGKCKKACPVLQGAEPEAEVPKAYMLHAQDETLRKASSSGGAFSMLALEILKKGGIVFGCGMTDDCYQAGHIYVDSAEELGKLRGSKYVQSDMGNVMKEVKEALERDRWVLFSGTPCQVAGLQVFLGRKKYSKLLTVDVICHGVPSPVVWESYVKELEAGYGSKAVAVSFRDKSAGWRVYSLTCDFESGARYSGKITEDAYLRGFVSDLYLRPSCYHCAFKDRNYYSDLTLADFWGVDRYDPARTEDKGISLAVTHTIQGAEAVKALENVREVPLQTALKSNASYYKAVAPNLFRGKAIEEIEARGVTRTVEKYCGKSLVSKVRRKLAKVTNRIIQK